MPILSSPRQVADSWFMDYGDPANYREASCGPAEIVDSVEDIFAEICRQTMPPQEFKGRERAIWRYCESCFNAFWSEYERQGNTPDSSASEAVIRLLQILERSNKRQTAIRAECYLAVINRKSESQTDIARKYGIGRAAISKVIKDIQRELSLGEARHMKSEEACASYRERALRVHAERKKDLCKKPKSSNNLFQSFWSKPAPRPKQLRNA